MRSLKHLLLFIGLLLTTSLVAQKKDYKLACVGFYNVENLFDTLDNELTRDEEFTPSGDRRYTAEVYYDKLNNLANVISQIGIEKVSDGAAVLGLCEVENRAVVEDLVKHPKLADRNYQIIHYESPDFRGIDVALLYQEKYFQPTNSKKYPLNFMRGNEFRHSRDLLLVSGMFDGEEMHFIVNHWPSRSGGEKKSSPNREKAARICKGIVDSLMTIDPMSKIIIMGDLNDDPSSKSVKNVLQARKKIGDTPKKGLFNPTYDPYRRGLGSTAWRDSWGLFDQVIVSHAFLDKKQEGYFYYKTIIFNKKFLIQKTGHFQGYPMRTYSGGNYIGGYSDHFPVFLYILKEI